MLALSRRIGETIETSNGIVVKVLKLGKGQVRLGVEAAKHIKIWRGELPASEQEGVVDDDINRELTNSLETAIWRIKDMLMDDDGEAWSEAEKALPRLEATLIKARK